MAGEQRRIRLIMELRGSGVNDLRVLSALERTPRDNFVPATFSDQAWDNAALPIGQGQTISQPLVVALMTQALALDPKHRVLEIGTGSGYQASILALLCRRVYTIERHRPLLDQAEQRFKELRLANVTTRFGDGSKGWPEQAPFDRILATACAPDLPAALTSQMVDGGIMVLPIGDNDHQDVVKVVKEGDQYHSTVLFPVRFVPLVSDSR